MNKIRNKVNLDKTLSYTQSSYTYKDPFNPNRSFLMKLKNRIHTALSVRNIENEFIDFKPHNLQGQFSEIYADLHAAYKRGDKVILQRSLSEPMLEHIKALLKEKRPSPFFRSVEKLELVQARNYAETDHLLPEEQWAQLTFKQVARNSDEEKPTVQYVVFERRLADKLSYMDWKLSYAIEEEDFSFLHAQPGTSQVQRDVKRETANSL